MAVWGAPCSLLHGSWNRLQSIHDPELGKQLRNSMDDCQVEFEKKDGNGENAQIAWKSLHKWMNLITSAIFNI